MDHTVCNEYEGSIFGLGEERHKKTDKNSDKPHPSPRDHHHHLNIISPAVSSPTKMSQKECVFISDLHSRCSSNKGGDPHGLCRVQSPPMGSLDAKRELALRQSR